MDHHYHSRRSVLARDQLGRGQAFAWLVLIMMGIFAIGESRPSDIECLRSIKESFQDPLNHLASWDLSNFTTSSFCRFAGVQCWHDDDLRVLNVSLRGMGLRGEFPRGISNCVYLTSLDLSNNHLYGSIPSDISEILRYLTSLDISNNAFSGEIPVDLANCSYLNVLKLDNNLLTGQIPPQLGRLYRLKIFTVANNLLSGPVPIFVNSTIPAASYANNAGLCGGPLGACVREVEQHLFVLGFFTGWGVFFILFLVVGLFSPFWEYTIKFMKKKSLATPRLQSLLSSQRVHNAMISRLEEFVTRISFLELREATDNFSEYNVIARGEMGTTYKAMLSNGYCLAIKRLNNSPDIEHEFLSEIKTLGRLKHGNLVSLLGFCYESDERLLIYKFMPKGSLHDCLFSSDGEAKIMEWPVRAKIAVGIAKGIAWLHLNGVVHHRISSKCILLDGDLNPRISDFGKATSLDHDNSSLEISVNREFSVLYEEDVYSFGTVLLEVITGTRYNEIVSSFDINASIFEQISHLSIEPGPLGVCVQSMMEQGFSEEISRFLRVAAKCLKCDPFNWPSMEEVYQMLTGKRRDEAVDGSGISLKNVIECADFQTN